MRYTQSISGTTYEFDGLVDLMAKATRCAPATNSPGARHTPTPNVQLRHGNSPTSR
ncbi:hypothetical protein D7316_03397 [Gordonia insulae]|uniref:Uncharacterized protein n=1 Tax=Gordonia insulae TaxID=2420509 RepID=A0A3G8JQQ9_9ACTN|nr:hypothetical protein D7316_03397 [Gordonia insulae]